MFNYTGDEVWVENLPNKPAMDPVLGALLVVGAAAAIAVSVKKRNPWPVAVLGAGLLMLAPSAVNIAFPRENPSVGRAAGALPMLMIVCALVPGMLLDITRQYRWLLARLLTPVVILALSGAIIGLNIDRVFVQYPAVYCANAQNASDIAREIRAFYEAGNPRSNAWIGIYPHWVDHRLVGIWLGDVNFSNVAEEHGTRVDLEGKAGLFVLNVADQESLDALREKYPEGEARMVSGSQCPNRQFVLFSVPPE
jgi:hypothetical protein